MKKSRDKTLLLTSEDIQSIISRVGLDKLMDKLIQKIEIEIQKFEPEEIVIPKRDGFNYKAPALGLVEWMPLWQKGKEVTIKVVGYHPNNPINFGVPTILSTISQYDTHTGHLLGVVDGVLLTALRTGAASAVASKFMASANSKSLGLIGCGAQSITQLHALSRIYDFQKVRFYDVDTEVMKSFVSRAEVLGLNLAYEESSIERIVADSDIVCTATSIDVNEGPLFKGLEYQKHVHFNAIGSDFPGKVEVPMEIIEESFICPDFIDQALIEGECQRLKREDIDADLSTIVKSPGSYTKIKDQVTVFDSTGWALEDHVVMNMFLEFAEEFGVGKWTAIEFLPEDPKDPYFFVKNPMEVVSE